MYTSVADVYQENKQLELAIKYYKRSLDITNTNFPENHFEIAVNYQNMGALYSKLGMNTEAISLYEKARSIWLKSSLKGHKKFKELDEAIQARMKAIVDKQSEPYTDQSTAHHLDNLFRSYVFYSIVVSCRLLLLFFFNRFII
jgi:tetratricopeptide (TPR) repeat protein